MCKCCHFYAHRIGVVLTRTYVLYAGFSINGVILSDSFGDPIAFSQFDLKGGLVPAVTLGPEQEVKFNFGKNEVSDLQYYTVLGLTCTYSTYVRILAVCVCTVCYV